MKLQDLFLGVADLFVILLPGALVLYLAAYAAYDYPVRPLPSLAWSPAEKWAALAFLAYLIGHLVSNAASAAEDWFYARGGRKRIAGDDPELREDAVEVARTVIGAARVDEYDIRRWAAARVALRSAGAARRLERKDADRRFFRNVLLVLLALPVVAAVKGAWLLAGIGALALGLATWRYFDQQRAQTRWTLTYFIALHTADAPTTDLHARERPRRDPEQRDPEQRAVGSRVGERHAGNAARRLSADDRDASRSSRAGTGAYRADDGNR